MNRAYSVLAYLAFTVTTVWAILFLADLPGAPTTVDGPAGVPPDPVAVAVAVDLTLLLLFAVQHSVMARPAVKQRMRRVVPPPVERSTYVLAASLCLALQLWLWRPVPAPVWHVGAQPWAGVLWAACGAGWALALGSTFMIDHREFAGLRQAGWGRPVPPAFVERLAYRLVRHPMMLGLLVAFWATPSMSVGHLLFAAAASGYVAVGIRFEERDLRRELGGSYRAYGERVPALLPRLRRVTAGAAGSAGPRP